jgi:hypothetical protein
MCCPDVEVTVLDRILVTSGVIATFPIANTAATENDEAKG